jgi:hypothetical protein
LAFMRRSKGCKRAAEAEVVAVREWEKPQEEELIVCKVSLAFRRSSRGCKRAAEAGVVAVRVGEAARGGVNSFVRSIWHLRGAAKAIREQQKRR